MQKEMNEQLKPETDGQDMYESPGEYSKAFESINDRDRFYMHQ